MDTRIHFHLHKGLWLGLLLGLLLALAMDPGVAQARSLSMQQVVIDAQVLPDASMRVTERLTIKFSGQWNGFYIKIPQGDTPIVEAAVQEKGKAYTFNPGTEYGPPGTYLVKNEGSQFTVDWSISARDEVRTFDVSYRVLNAVKVHQDVAELYRKFIGEANGNQIGSVQVNLKLPAGAEKYKQGEDIRIWGHGPLNGEVEFAGADRVVWKVQDLSPYTFVEGRVVMPTALFPAAPKAAQTGRTALAPILTEEEGWAKKANKERLQARGELAGGAAIIGGTLFGLLVLWRRFGRRHPTTFDGDYYRDLPASYSPAELSVLWNYKKMQAQDLTATILDLARRRFIRLDQENVEVRRLLGSKEVTTYRITFLPPPDPAAARRSQDAVLQPHERQLLDFLRDEVGEGRESLYLTDIERFSKQKATQFYGFWKEWTSGLITRGEGSGFFDTSGNMTLLTVLGGVGLFGLGGFLARQSVVAGISIIIAGALLLFIPLLFKRRSATGQEDYVRWQAFKRFLEHFSEMQRHEIPSLIIWEHYLVYAVTLGVAKEVIKQLEVVFPNLQDGDYRFGYGWMTYGSYNGMNNLYGSFDSIGDSIQRAFTTAEKAVSKSSSGSGGGGGFSGGGGGGGGGSSYGGR
ncbi:MAG TPA: DUF2207 domain-containing protein [Syntrophomonadaceae bacterium]|nr:DUF2207 domain-containing protein [Syntrophomonadaceae bacterium]